MFKDTEEELHRLEQELLSEEEPEEEWEEETEEADDMDATRVVPGPVDDSTRIFNPDAQLLSREDAPECRLYNGDRTDLDPEDYSQELLQPEHRSNTGLIVLAVLLTAGIVGVIAWWLLKLRGILP